MLKKEESKDEDDNEDEGSNVNIEEYDPMEAEEADDDDDDDKDDEDSNGRDRRDDRRDDRKSKERSSKDKEKKQMVTHNKDLLMAFVYFDQSHCGYLLEKDLEEIMYTLGLHLSRAQVKKLLNKPVIRESCFYRKLTDRPKDEGPPSFGEALLDNLLGNTALLPSHKYKRETSETNQSGSLIVYNGAMVDVGSMMQKLEKSEKAREEIELKLMTQDTKIDEDANSILQLETTNRSLSQDLEAVKSNLTQTEGNLSSTEEKKTCFEDQLQKTVTSLNGMIKELQNVLQKEDSSEDGDQKSQANGPDE